MFANTVKQTQMTWAIEAAENTEKNFDVALSALRASDDYIVTIINPSAHCGMLVKPYIKETVSTVAYYSRLTKIADSTSATKVLPVEIAVPTASAYSVVLSGIAQGEGIRFKVTNTGSAATAAFTGTILIRKA